jgi:4-alpha-glucanotransferase
MSLSPGRHAGLLVPLFSIPTRASWGIGEIGDLPAFASWVREAGLDLLQLLPIHEMAVGQRSPYSAMTAMAVDPIFISVGAIPEFVAAGGEAAMGREWRQRLDDARRSPAIDHALVRSVKEPALAAAFAEFERRATGAGAREADAFEAWCATQSWWLDDYALFRALHARLGERPWHEWPAPLRDREPEALVGAARELAAAVRYRQWVQFVADLQWREAKARARPVCLFGDLPFMVDGDSADVWADTSSFRLDVSIGAPPDAFSATGQNWGMPAYAWDNLAARDFGWLRRRALRTAALYDGYRVDHLVGFYRTYLFPHDGSAPRFDPADEPAQLALGERVLSIFAGSDARIIAEDLGTVPDFVRQSLARLGVPGCKVFRWERRWEEPGRPYRDPAAYPAVSMATSGTHDTETVAAWWDGLDAAERAAVLAAPGIAGRASGIDNPGGDFSPALRDLLLEVLFASGSDILLLPIQDVFGWRDRINVPASINDHNWTWRLPWPSDTLADQPEARERAAALRQMSAASGRL